MLCDLTRLMKNVTIKEKKGMVLVATQEAKAAIAKYMREWRAKNKEKVQAYNAKYWEKRAKEQKEG